MVDVVGLYLNPREQALVLSHAKKTGVKSLNRANFNPSGLESEDRWHLGSTTLVSALSELEASVKSTCQDRHRHEDWLKFLRRIDRKTPKHLQVHLIIDNQATHKRPKVQAWLAQRPRFVIHSTPADEAWLNMVKRHFCDMADHCINHESFSSVAQLQKASAQYLAQLKRKPSPFSWTVSEPDTAKDKRIKAALARWAISAEQAGAASQ